MPRKKKILYRKEPLAGAEVHPEALRNGMREEDVAKVQAKLEPKMEEAKTSWKEARVRWKDSITELIRSRTLVPEEEQEKGTLVNWLSGQRFPQGDVESIKACFGKHLDLLRRVGSRYVAEGDINELTRIVRKIRGMHRAESEARKFLQLDGESGNGGRIIVGRKLGMNYVVAAVHEICRSGSVTILGRNVGKVKAIADICNLVWPELRQLGIQNGSENVNGRELRNVEIQLGV